MIDYLFGRAYTNVNQLMEQFGLTRTAAITVMKEFVHGNTEFKFYAGRVGIPSCVVRIAPEYAETKNILTTDVGDTIPVGSVVGIKLHTTGLYEVYWGGVCTYANDGELKIN
jgi:hypothetical protein